MRSVLVLLIGLVPGFSSAILSGCDNYGAGSNQVGCDYYSCKDLKRSGAPTGEYIIRLRGSDKPVHVWCEMALGSGGGYTFVKPTVFYTLSVTEQRALLSQIYTQKTDVLLRVRKSNGKQPFALLKQLNTRSSSPIYVGFSEHVGHAAPVNAQARFMANPFLYVGFFPISDAAHRGTRQGLASNGVQCAFTNCDANPNNFVALFPNLQERPSSDYHYAPDGWGTGGPCGCIRNSLKHNPSGHVMPSEFYMFTELHWGGCGCYGQTDETSNDILGGAIGLK